MMGRYWNARICPIGRKTDLGCTTGVEHYTNTGEEGLFNEILLHTPIGFQDQEPQQLAQMMGVGVYQPTDSVWASLPVLVLKDDDVRWGVGNRSYRGSALEQQQRVHRIMANQQDVFPDGNRELAGIREYVVNRGKRGVKQVGLYSTLKPPQIDSAAVVQSYSTSCEAGDQTKEAAVYQFHSCIDGVVPQWARRKRKLLEYRWQKSPCPVMCEDYCEEPGGSVSYEVDADEIDVNKVVSLIGGRPTEDL